MSNQYLSFDVTKQSAPQQLITGRQGDSQLKFTSVLLWDGNKNIPYDLTDKKIAFEALKPDGKHIVDYEGITILDAPHGLFRYSFNEQVFAVAGKMQQAFFKITHTDKDDQVITDSTLEISIHILENRVEFGINSTDYLSEYDDLIAQVKQKFDDYAATVQDSIDKANALHDQIVEYINLINTKGVVLAETFGNVNGIKQPIGTNFVDKLNNEFFDRGINVKWFGAKGDGKTDDTEAINQAIAATNSSDINTKKVFIPNGIYMIKAHVPDFAKDRNYLRDEGGIQMVDGVDLILDKNATLSAIPNNADQSVIVRMYDVKNVSLSGGNILGDVDGHIGNTGEWGYGIALSGATNVKIKDVHISKCWGDGINIQIVGDEGGRPSKNVTIDGIVATNNRRQGMSVEGVDGLLVNNSEFSNTSGTAPECGVDIEPWSSKNTVRNVTFSNCQFLNNNNAGLLAMAGVMIILDKNIFKGNEGKGTNNGQLTTYLSSSATNIRILNNQFIDDTNHSMTLRGGADYLISGNEMEQGILLDQSSDKKNIMGITIMANTILPTGLVDSLWDIIKISNVFDLIISNNKFDTTNVYNGHALMLIENVSDGHIMNNKLINSPRSIVVSSSTNIDISNNTIDNPGIYAVQIIGNSKDVHINNNYMYGVAHQSAFTAAIRAQDEVTGIKLRDNKVYQEPRKTNTVNLGKEAEIYTFQRTDGAALNTVSSGNINIGDGSHTAPIFIQQNSPMTTGYIGESGGGIMSVSSRMMPTSPTTGTLCFDETNSKLKIYQDGEWKTVSIS